MILENRVGSLIACYDIETGGFKAEKNPLVEIAFICYDTITMKEVDRYEAIIQPYHTNPKTGGDMTYEPSAERVHGITIARMENEGKSLEVVVKEVVAKLKLWTVKGGGGAPILCGHNIKKFDTPFIKEVFSWFKVDIEKLTNTKMQLDTMIWAQQIWPQRTNQAPEGMITNHQLGTVAEKMGVSLENAHRASADVEATGAVVLKWIDVMRGNAIQMSAGEVIENDAEPFKF